MSVPDCIKGHIWVATLEEKNISLETELDRKKVKKAAGNQVNMIGLKRLQEGFLFLGV